MKNIKLWGKNMPLFDESITNEQNEFAGTITPYLVEEEEGDIKKRGAVVICPGGGYSAIGGEGEKVASWFNFFGINAFVLNYRVAPYKFPAPLLDAKRAIRYLRHNAKDFNIDPEKIAIIGFSAGGHLAGLVSELFDEYEDWAVDEIDKISAKPDLSVLCYPVVSLCEDYGHKGSATNLLGDDTSLLEKLSLEKNVREDMPKMFVWHSAMDKVVSVRNSMELGIALSEKEVPFYLHVFQNGAHGIGLAENIEGTKEWTHLLKILLKDEYFVEKQSYRFL
ncbi:MAG: alpha/beta hydrolase [Eubacteriales bacterium]|nr:alpha/beta hydrolase [Eubacteriales bacterium]